MTDEISYPVPKAALLFMAAVNEARNTPDGPFRAISPLFQIALEPQAGQLFNFEIASRALQPVLGDNFTVQTLEAFAPNLVAMGWLVSESTGTGHAAYRVPASLTATRQAEAIESSEMRLGRLFDAFREFLDRTVPLFTVILDRKEFEWQFFNWCTSLDGADKRALEAFAGSLLDGIRPSIRNVFLDEPQRFAKVPRNLGIEFAGLVKWLVANRRAELSDVISLTKLGFIREFLDELRQPSLSAHTTVQTIFVLDSPVMLDLFGLSGAARSEGIKKCITALKLRGARFIALRHSLEELSEVLSTVLAKPEPLRYGLTGDALRANPALAEVARTAAQQPDKAAKAAGIDVLTFDQDAIQPPQRWFPNNLIDTFRNSASWHDPYKTEQRLRDALSVAYVMRRRQDKCNSDPFDNNIILVSRNSTFTQFSNSFARKNLGLPNFAFGPVIEIKTLAAFIWVRFGSESNDELPQIHLISACDRILAANQELMRKAEKKLKGMEGLDGAAALLNSHQAVLDLVVAVGGSPDVLDAADGDAIVRALTLSAEDRGRRKERELADAELSAVERYKAEQAAELGRLQAKSQEIALQKLRAEGENRALQQQLSDRNDADHARAKLTASKYNQDAEEASRKITRIVWILSATISLLGQLFIWSGPSWWSTNYFNAIVGIFIIAVSLATISLSSRFFLGGKLDLAAVLEKGLRRRLLLGRLSQIIDRDERDRVRAALRESGALSR